jgi:hypothetical protein
LFEVYPKFIDFFYSIFADLKNKLRSHGPPPLPVDVQNSDFSEIPVATSLDLKKREFAIKKCHPKIAISNF